MADKNTVLEQVKSRWQQLIEKDKSWKEISKVHVDLIQRMEAHKLKITPISMDEDEALYRLREGQPLMGGLEEHFDLTYAVALFRDLTDWSGTGDTRKALKKWSKSLSDAEIEGVLAGWVRGDLEPFTHWTMQSGMSQNILMILIQYSLLPTLYAYGQGLMPNKTVLDDNWKKGYCPVCGDSPTLAEIRDSERFRYLRCTSCGGDWQYKRIACFNCGNEDHEKLETFFIEDPKTVGKYQIDVCHDCSSYIKVSNKLQPSRPELLLLDDLSTTHLDVFALEHGYQKGGKPDGELQ